MAYDVTTRRGMASRRVLAVLVPLALLGPVAALAGFYLLAGRTHLIAWILMGAAGAIIYGVFQDVAPEARRRAHWSPTLGAALGFLMVLLGMELLGV